MYPLRIVRKDSVLVDTTGHDYEGDYHTGLTNVCWNKLNVTNITDTGIYIIGSGMLQPKHVDWDRLSLYRVLVVRMGRSKKPGRSWELVERWYLHKINVEATIAAYERAWKAQDDPKFVRPPRASDWEIR